MPAIYWLPLPGLRGPAAVEHVHAAFSGWFDAASTHHDNVKPYRLTPASQRAGVWGVEVSVLSEDAYLALAAHLEAGDPVRLGSVRTPVGEPTVLRGASWSELEAWPGESAWRVEFLTPFAFRTGDRTSPFPLPAVVVRAATEAWAAFSGRPPVRLEPPDQAHVWVSSVELTTTRFQIGRHRFPGALGHVVYRCDEPSVSPVLSTLLRLGVYCGMGSFRGKGMGVVDVEEVQ